VVDAAQLKAVSDADDWTRTGTEITPKVAGDSVFTSGAVKVGGTTAAPNLQLKADGGIVANTNGLFYDAATKRLGIGNTAPSFNLDVLKSSAGTAARFQANGTDSHVSVRNSAREGIIGTDTAQSYLLNSDAFPWTFWTNNIERARIDSSGRLLVGTTSWSTGATSVLQGNSTEGTAGAGHLILAKGLASGASIGSRTTIGAISFADNAGGVFAKITAEGDAPAGTNNHPGRLVFATTANGANSPTEGMVFDSNRGLLVYTLQDPGFKIASQRAAGATDRIMQCAYGATGVSTGTLCLQIYTNGNVQNTNNSYGSLSDVKLKENIADASSQWADLKALRVRNYNFKEGQTHRQIGLIAQEVELISPGLVSESPDRDEDGNDLGTVTKSVNYSVLYMKAVKALQEAMERIETLESKVAALEGPAPSKRTDPGVK